MSIYRVVSFEGNTPKVVKVDEDFDTIIEHAQHLKENGIRACIQKKDDEFAWEIIRP